MISLIIQSPSRTSPLPGMGFGNLLQMGQDSFEQHLARLLYTKEYLLIPTSQEAGNLGQDPRVPLKQSTSLGKQLFSLEGSLLRRC